MMCQCRLLTISLDKAMNTLEWAKLNFLDTSPNEIVKLLLKLPYVIKAGPLPPCRVMNDLLRRGIYDVGMSGVESWKPFEISEGVYAEVVIELHRLKEGLIEGGEPADIEKLEDWINWRLIQSAGDKGGELSDLLGRREALVRHLKLAELKKNSDDEVGEIQIQLIDIDAAISDILVELKRASRGKR